MSDWRDVMEARSHADRKMIVALDHVKEAPRAANDPYALLVAVTFCAQAICAELRALGTTIDFGAGS